jgi:hypothetical protein
MVLIRDATGPDADADFRHQFGLFGGTDADADADKKTV